jgi:hypothetical protein
MKLNINHIYKVNEEQDVLEQPEYSYWVCIGEKEDYFILHEAKQFCLNNGMDFQAFEGELEETLPDDKYKSLDRKFFKQYNSLEAIYHKSEIIDEEDVNKKFENNFQVV